MNQEKIDMLIAVNQIGLSLEYASSSLRANKEVVLAAVNNDGRALYYTSESLKDDKEVVLAAVNTCGWALDFTSESLRNDKYFLYEIDQVRKIIKYDDVYNCLNKNIKNKIYKNPDYLLKFEPVNFKPARSS